MSIIRAMAIFQGASQLPEDRFVNTFYFQSASDYATAAPLAATAVDDFYSATTNPTQVHSIGAWMSPYVSELYEIRTYDMDEQIGDPPLPKVRTPTIFSETRTASTSAGGLPEEIALCLTIRAAVPPNSPRRRGRLYLGPFANAAYVAGVYAAGAQSHPNASLVTDIQHAAERLALHTDVNWHVFSHASGDQYFRVTNGWVDDAWDIQRRRGPASTSRGPWSVTL